MIDWKDKAGLRNYQDISIKKSSQGDGIFLDYLPSDFLLSV